MESADAISRRRRTIRADSDQGSRYSARAGYVAMLNLLTAAEIERILAIDPNWTLPRDAQQAHRRMAEARQGARMFRGLEGISNMKKGLFNAGDVKNAR